MDGTPFGRYRLLELLGSGGMGEVWRAYDTETNRIVAVKVLPARLVDDEVFKERFRREANAAAGLNEPHVVPIHHFGEINGRLYVDMRVIEGRDLETLLSEGPLDTGRAVNIVAQVASALHAAHRVGLVHRDVKPSNILVAEDDFAYLIDFGIAQAAGEVRLTGTGAMIGTLAYMAPERFAAGQTDARTDVYALACVLHQALTGELPYPGDSAEEQIHGHLMTPPPQPSKRRTGIPRQLDHVIAIGMAKDPNERYSTTKELARAAQSAITTPMARPAAPAAPTRDLGESPTRRFQRPQPAPRQANYGNAPPSRPALPVPAASSPPPTQQAAAPPPTHAARPSDQVAAPRPTQSPPPAQPPSQPAAPATPEPSQPQSKRKAVAISAVVGCLVLIAGIVALVATRGSDESSSEAASSESSGTEESSPDATSAEPGTIPDIDSLLLIPNEVDAIMGTNGLTGQVVDSPIEDTSTVAPEECHSLALFASASDLADFGYADIRAQRLEFESIYASQAVIQYDTAEEAQNLVGLFVSQWERCRGQVVTDTADDGSGAWEYTVTDVAVGEHAATAMANEASNQHICQNRIQAASVFVVRVAVCSPDNNGQAETIAEKITTKIPSQ